MKKYFVAIIVIVIMVFLGVADVVAGDYLVKQGDTRETIVQVTGNSRSQLASMNFWFLTDFRPGQLVMYVSELDRQQAIGWGTYQMLECYDRGDFDSVEFYKKTLKNLLVSRIDYGDNPLSRDEDNFVHCSIVYKLSKCYELSDKGK